MFISITIIHQQDVQQLTIYNQPSIPVYTKDAPLDWHISK